MITRRVEVVKVAVVHDQLLLNSASKPSQAQQPMRLQSGAGQLIKSNINVHACAIKWTI